MLLCDISLMPIFVATIFLYVPELLAMVALWHITEPTIFLCVALPFAYIAWRIFICFVLKEIPRTFSSSGSFSIIFLSSIFFVLGLKFKLLIGRHFQVYLLYAYIVFAHMLQESPQVLSLIEWTDLWFPQSLSRLGQTFGA